MDIAYLPVIFFVIALFYSSVGFGGGSSYLAILSLFISDFYEIRSTALLLNICVVSIGTLSYIKHRVFNMRLFWPFMISSIPLAYLGAQLRLSQMAFFLILGLSLMLSGAFLILRFLRSKMDSKEYGLVKKISLGGIIGLLSGISGIGGGIFLSPLLNLYNWANPRTIAALASFFIFVNSVAGLFGLIVADTFHINQSMAIKLVIAVVLGGSIGSHLSNKRLNLRVLGVLTAMLVTYVGLRLVLLYGFDLSI